MRQIDIVRLKMYTNESSEQKAFHRIIALFKGSVLYESTTKIKKMTQVSCHTTPKCMMGNAWS